MKKIFIFALTIAVLFALIACGRREETPMQEESTVPTEDRTDDQTERNVPDPKVDDRSTTDEGKGILDEAMDKMKEKK